jgi:hypothetical protein
VALAYEATFRWDDFADTLLGDFIVTHEFVRVFLVDTKTDNYKSDQWATFSASPTETSAYTLLQKLVKNIGLNASGESLHNLENFPIMFKSLEWSGKNREIPKITYVEFLKELNTACAAIWLNPALFATHIIQFSLNFNWKLWWLWTSTENYPATKVTKLGIGKLASITPRNLPTRIDSITELNTNTSIVF